MWNGWKFVAAALALAPTAWSFCGFYVSQEPGSLFNRSSKVVLVRNGDHTVLTMANDYQGDPDAFGLVVPVPQEIEPEMVKIADSALIDRLEQYSVPRLAQYFDPDPCPEARRPSNRPMAPKRSAALESLGYVESEAAGPRDYGVQIEQSYSLEEYDIVVIRAKNGRGLEEWLRLEGYQVPEGASSILSSYIEQNMHFFLAKIDVSAQAELGVTWPRPLRVEYDSPKFMLPIRLGTVNADGPQDLLVFTLTPNGRVETTNYRTARLPTDVEVPEYIADGANFGEFYTAMFERRVARDGMSNVYLEYAWPMSQPCDPCSTTMLTPNEFAPLGADWAGSVQQDYHGGTVSQGYLTRLHVRYDAAHFPEDLVFQETPDTAPWQARYVVNRRFQGDTSCAEGERYETRLQQRQGREITNLAQLTGWDPAQIRRFLPPRR
ncbi:MAG: DUF2330 domain-containing protein [Myxococcota bacterium]